MSTSGLYINLDALVHNWETLCDLSPHAKPSAVLKADGYGLGCAAVAKALWTAGCRIFFVATAEEAFELADTLSPDYPAHISVLSDHTLHTSEDIWDYAIMPVLNTVQDVKTWAETCAKKGNPSPSFLHVDTGMNRLGMSVSEFNHICQNDLSLFSQAGVRMLMSHLACADDPLNPMNQKQLNTFKTVRSKLTKLKGSLSATCGVLLGQDYHQDLTRLGIGLYGGHSFEGAKTVLRWDAEILQVRFVPAGEGVGYGQIWQADKPTKVAVASTGYADGFPRAFQKTFYGTLGGYTVPLVGQVSMDLITFDVTNVPDSVLSSAQTITLIGSISDLKAMADNAGTISYEILTGLSKRLKRNYLQEIK